MSVTDAAPTRGLSDEARETLLRLQTRLTLDCFSEAAACELAALGYATRRSFILTNTDRGMLIARKMETGAPLQAHRQRLAVRRKTAQPRATRAETLLRYR